MLKQLPLEIGLWKTYVKDIEFTHWKFLREHFCRFLKVQEVDAMPDPCPLPSMVKKRGLNEKERLLYAPMSDVGGLLYDKDAVYIDVPEWKVFHVSLSNKLNTILLPSPETSPGAVVIKAFALGSTSLTESHMEGAVVLHI